MTQTRTPRRSLVLPLVTLVIGLILGLLAGAGIAELAAELTTGAAQPAEVQVNRIDAIPAEQPLEGSTASETLSGTEALSVGQLEQVEFAADRVCEGLTAGVPVMVLADTLVTDQGLTDEQARSFVREVMETRC